MLPSSENPTPPRRNINSVWSFLPLWTLKSTRSTTNNQVSSLHTTNSQTIPPLNTNKCLDIRRSQQTQLNKHLLWTNQFHHGALVLTGLQLVPSLQLKIKVSVVHAGLSPPLVLWKVPGKSALVNFFLSQNHNSLIALRHASAAVVETKLLHSITTQITSQCQNPHILTTPLLALALMMLTTHTQTSKLLVTSQWQLTQSMLFKLQLLNNQLLSQSKLTLLNSNPTDQVFSIALLVVHPLTTPSSLLVMVLKTAKTTGS